MTSKPLTKNGPNGISLFPSFFIRYKAYGKAINEANTMLTNAKRIFNVNPITKDSFISPPPKDYL